MRAALRGPSPRVILWRFASTRKAVALLAFAAACVPQGETVGRANVQSQSPASAPPSSTLIDGTWRRTGRISIWKNTSVPGGVAVSINGTYAGLLADYFASATPSCAALGTLTVELAEGPVTVVGEASDGRRWAIDANVRAAGCTLILLTEAGRADRSPKVTPKRLHDLTLETASERPRSTCARVTSDSLPQEEKPPCRVIATNVGLTFGTRPELLGDVDRKIGVNLGRTYRLVPGK